MNETERLRVVIVDDEEPARLAIRQDLVAIGGVEIVAECANGFEAVKVVTESRPDVLLLDVQMPKLDGFEVLELVGGDVPVVFVTAYDEFALKAFEVHAVDYLLKPFSRERLAAALERVRERGGRPPVSPAVLRASARPAGRAARAGRHPRRRAGARRPGRQDRLRRSAGRLRGVRTAGKVLLKEQTLGDLEGQLDPRRFVRIHRSYLLNIDRLSRVELYAKDSRVAILQDGTKLPVSRAGYQRLQRLL